MRYDNWKWGVEPFKPNHMVYQSLVVSAILMIFVLVIVFVPDLFMLRQKPADPLSTPLGIKPEWYFLPAYQALKLVPQSLFGQTAEFLSVVGQMVFVLAVMLLPFLDRNPHRHPAKRPVMMTIGAITAVVVLVLGIWGHLS